MNTKQSREADKKNFLVCKNTFKESREDEKGKLFTAKWIKAVEECEKKNLFN